MSKDSNVNPGQYKVAGREKQGNTHDTQEEHKQDFAKSHEETREGNAAAPKENRKPA